MSSSNPTTSSSTLSTILNSPSSDPQQRKILAYLLAAAATSAAATGIWWITKESYYSYVPLRYQYRPGTISGWVSSLLAKHAKRRRSRRPIRVYMDGCFDLMHYGHANALRQAKSLGDELVVGLIPDSEIRRCKGPPLMNEEERLEMVESVKWVDEVLTHVPYDLTPAFLEELIHKHKIDYVIHGDDPCLLPDGTDAYEYAKKAGRFRLIKRTEGVSTTDIVGRMLMCSRINSRFSEAETTRLTKEFSMGGRRAESIAFDEVDDVEVDEVDHHHHVMDHIIEETEDEEEEEEKKKNKGKNKKNKKKGGTASNTSPSSALPNKTTAQDQQEQEKEQQQQEGISLPDASTPPPPPIANIHTHPSASSKSPPVTPSAIPRKAVGSDAGNRPITVSRFMPTSRRIVQFSSGKSAPRGAKIVYIDGAFDLFHEGHVRILKAAKEQGDFLLVGVHTDEEVTERRGPHLPIMGLHERALSVLACRFADEVIIGAPQVITEDLLTTFGISKVIRGTVHEATNRSTASEEERYAVPRQRGILKDVGSPSSMTSATLIRRIVENRAMFEEKHAKKEKSEAAYYTTSKQYIDEV